VQVDDDEMVGLAGVLEAARLALRRLSRRSWGRLDPGTLVPDLIRLAVFSLRTLQPRRERGGIRAAWSRYVRFARGHPSPRPNRTWGQAPAKGTLEQEPFFLPDFGARREADRQPFTGPRSKRRLPKSFHRLRFGRSDA
jgi:hypothetical protein